MLVSCRKTAVILACVVVVLVRGAPQQPTKEPVPIISQESDIQPDGTFKWSFEAGDGTKAEQSGQPKQIEKETPVVMQGAASWTDNEGGQHQLTYTADENGYQPQSPDIPVAPEIPAAIQRALEYNAAHPEQDNEQ
ncbi:endocuticle structural glycoprotein ABD-4-like [Euwallacea similis]|uniref:endocuticle structural glycoprotein ABD-4-like n=1 Tax=Euwallacea similis TaxID=1736056 RepID=UPI00344BC6EA